MSAILDYAVPSILLLWWVFAPAGSQAVVRGAHITIFLILAALLLTITGEAASIIVHALTKPGWYAPQHRIVYLLGSFCVWSGVLASLVGSPRQLWSIQTVGGFASGFLFEGVRLVLTAKWSSRWQAIALGLVSARTTLLAAAFVIALAAPRNPSETQPLLHEPEAPAARPVNHATPYQKDAMPPKSTGGAITYLRKFFVFFPHLWPKDDRKLQLVVMFCFVLLLAARVINVLVPRQLGIVTDGLAHSESNVWWSVLIYVSLRFLQSNMGVLGALRTQLWIPVGQYTYRSLATSSFEHVHSLSLDFHIGKKTGEVLSALDKGSAINSFLEQLVFNVLPVIVDLFVAVVYFLVEFDALFAMIVGAMTVAYLFATVKITEWRTNIRRDMVNKSRDEYGVKADSITNYETVKYFNAERWEFARYRKAVETFQAAEWKVLSSLNLMNVTQNLIFTLGLLAVCLLSAYRVSFGQSTVGGFVAILTYMAQLQGPLNFFGTLYRSLQSNLVNAERMLELFTQGATVKDADDARELVLSAGQVRFDDVTFSYDGRRPALQNLSFVARPGQTVALVGESGAGKTTILRSLFRFYDVTSGSITIDSQDIRSVTMDSLRRTVGVVPQDTVLFNDTILFNIRYAKPDATIEEVHEAARQAQIHDKIVSWPDGYESKVGERGLRLSGGEKQRIAIARTILKNPSVILLDEATSALDTTTERHIQRALDTLSQGRTTIVIAHRLSTVIHADQILVLAGGKVVESGTHQDLLEVKDGVYHGMWQKQITRDLDAAKEVPKATE
ncbi:ATP-binding cassette-type vacuolar membrane transporter Hmt1 [Savitreella phatthalungensis]